MKFKEFTPIMWLYLCLSIMGLSVAWYFNIKEIIARGQLFSLTDWFNASMGNNLSQSAMYDFLFGITTFFIWMLTECKRLKMNTWFFIFAFAICFAFCCPFFLLKRQIIINKNLPYDK